MSITSRADSVKAEQIKNMAEANINDSYIKDVDKVVGQIVHSLRMDHNAPRKKLAKTIGVSTQQLCKYETGINTISFPRLILIAKAFGKNTDYFSRDFLKDKQSAFVSDELQEMLAEVSRDFMKIRNLECTHALSDLIKTLSEQSTYRKSA